MEGKGLQRQSPPSAQGVAAGKITNHSADESDSLQGAKFAVNFLSFGEIKIHGLWLDQKLVYLTKPS